MTAERPFYIYCHTAPNGKRYIGQTSKEPKIRWNNGLGYLNCTYFRHAIEKYGWENFRHDIICVVHSERLAHLFERYYIQKYDTFNHDKGYNLTLGGEGTVGHELSEEARRKISEANTGNFWDEERKKKRSEMISGDGNPMYGRHHSEESRRKMSENRKGKYISPEMREFRTNVLLEAAKKMQKPIRQLDMDGNVIATYEGISAASRITGINHANIASCCLGNRDKAHGFRWEYLDEESRAKAEARRKERKLRKKERTRTGDLTGPTAVIQFDMSENEVGQYASLSEAERKTGLHRDRIGDCCHGGMESYGGYVWKFKNEGQQGAEKSAVIQKSLDGIEIARFDSLAEASSKTGTPRYQIRNCCRGRKKIANGCKWEFADEDMRNNVPPGRVGVIQLDMSGNEVARYKSLAEAMRATGQDRHRIVECCKGVMDSYRNTKWRYATAA